MPDALATQFGALEKLIKASAKAEHEQALAMQLFQLGQQKAVMAADEEMQLAEAEAAGRAKASQAQQQPQQPFQLQLPEGGAFAERPVAFRNPLSQLQPNAFSQAAQMGGPGGPGGPGALIQQRLHDAGVVPPGVPDAAAGLPVAGDTLQTMTADVGFQPHYSAGEFEMAPSVNMRTQTVPNQLTANDIAQLRQAQAGQAMQERLLNARMEAEGAAAKKAARADHFLELNQRYGGLVNSSKLVPLADAMAEGDTEKMLKLAGDLPRFADKPDKQEQIMQRQLAMKALEFAEKDLSSASGQIANLENMDRMLADAQRVLGVDPATGKPTGRGPSAVTGKLRGAPLLVALQQSLGTKEYEEASNILQQAFGAQWVSAVQSVRGAGPISDYESQKLEKLSGGMDRSLQFNLDDIAARRAAVKEALKLRSTRRSRAVANQRAAFKLGGLEEAFQPLEDGGGAPALAPTEPAAAPADMVSVIAPDGSRGRIPRDRLAEAIKRGAKVAQ